LKRYRDGYPGQEDDLTMNDNYMFYSGQISSRPDGMKMVSVSLSKAIILTTFTKPGGATRLCWKSTTATFSGFSLSENME